MKKLFKLLPTYATICEWGRGAGESSGVNKVGIK